MPHAAPPAAPDIAPFVAHLPERYQPIYGHPEFSDMVSRDSVSRLSQITAIYRIAETGLGRPLRVLDLGCAQGFFSLSLAALGAEVCGVDFQAQNVAVCTVLAMENLHFKLRFLHDRVENIIAGLAPGAYDLVLGLSVFHHIAHLHGIGATQDLLGRLAQKTMLGVYEMATAAEPQAWAASQPANPRDLLKNYAFTHLYAYNATHLSSVARPLYIASDMVWLLDGRATAFDAWRDKSHLYAGRASDGTRRYYFSADAMAKCLNLENPDWAAANLEEYQKEADFLAAPPPDFIAPRLISHGRNDAEAWLVRERLAGDLLIDLIAARKPFDADMILHDILAQLAALERAGLRHGDVRVWNVLIGPDGHAVLIDYGAIAAGAADCLWPHDVFLSFVTFMHEVLTGAQSPPAAPRPAMTNPETLPEPYRTAVWEMMRMPRPEWGFSFLCDALNSTRKQELNP